jgi:hypothetical protein
LRPLDPHTLHIPFTNVRLPLGALGGQDDELFATPVDSTHDEFELQRPPELPAKVPA